MAYTPPVFDSVDFVIAGTYTPPDKESINFNLGGVTTTTIDCVNAPFEVNTQCSPDESPEWTYPLIPIEGSSDLGSPNISLSIPVPELECSTSFTGSPQPRISCREFNSFHELEIQNIALIPEGFTVIAPPGFMCHPSMTMDSIATTILGAVLRVSSTFETPTISADGVTRIDCDPLASQAEVKTDIMPSNIIPAFESGPVELYCLAVKSMPAGDVYLGCPPFDSPGAEIGDPIVGFAFPMPAFESGSALSLEDVYHGDIAVLEPMQISEELSSLVNAALGLQPFQSVAEFSPEAGIDVSVYSSPVEVSSSLGVDDIVIGEFVELTPFEASSTIKTGINVGVWLTDHLTMTSEFGVPSVTSTVICAPFEASNSVDVADIKIFNLDFATQFYYFKLTDPKGDQGDVWIPISSFQSRRRNGAPSYLQVVVPGYDSVPDIEARTGGNLEVYLTHKLENEIVRQTKIIDATMDEIRIDEGSNSKSVTLTGYKTETFVSKSVELEGATYRSTTSGKLRYRIASPSLDLNPGDTVSISGDVFKADVVSYYFGAKRNGMSQNMEVAEA